VAELRNDNLLTAEQRGLLKNLIVCLDPTVLAVAECLQHTKDFDDMLDSLLRICANYASQEE